MPSFCTLASQTRPSVRQPRMKRGAAGTAGERSGPLACRPGQLSPNVAAGEPTGPNRRSASNGTRLAGAGPATKHRETDEDGYREVAKCGYSAIRPVTQLPKGAYAL